MLKINSPIKTKPIINTLTPQKEVNINIPDTALKKENEYPFNSESFLVQKNIPLKNHSIGPVIPKDAFYIRMKSYGINDDWAQEMINLTYVIAYDIKNNEDFDDILLKISQGIRRINFKDEYGRKRITLGIYALTPNGRGEEYFENYRSRFKNSQPYISKRPSSNTEYSDANICDISINENGSILIKYGWNPRNKGKNLELAKKEFEKLRSIKNPTDEEINRSIATIHWLIAQESPWERGSDSIANILTKAIYQAYNMQITPIKEGKSFDFEAFFCSLENYIKKYPDLFEIPPHR